RSATPVLASFAAAFATSIADAQQWQAQQVLANTLQAPIESDSIDLDGDGDIDFVTVVLGTDEIVWHRNNGNGTYNTFGFVTGLNNPGNLVVADVDGDGDDDIVGASSGSFFPPGLNSELFLLQNNGGGNWAFSWTNTSPGFPFGWDFQLADMNNDGNLDLVQALGANFDQIGWRAGNGTSGPLAFGPAGNVVPVTTGGQGDEPRDIELADVDGDGDIDVLVCFYISDELAYFRNNGNGATFTKVSIETGALGVRTVKAGDLNGDGIVDVVRTTVLNGQLAYFPGTGGGSFGPKVIVNTYATSPTGGGTSGIDPMGPRGLDVADLDGDGDLDLVVASEANNRVRVHYNDGSGNFIAPATNASANAGSVSHVFTVDADGDGDLDVLSTAPATGRVRLHRNLCDQGCATVTTYGSGCAGAPSLTSNNPKLNGSWDLTINGLGAAPAAFLWFGNQASNPGLPLAALGAPGCSAYTNGNLGAFLVLATAGSGVYPLSVPNNTALIGASLACQATAATTLNSFGIATSNGLLATVGN
ncbi:MAG: VCBS repeat-containing protein, partial [Planctomycetota bacterium]|nr:VCBS repeat-containing protein [Planctomycetota bacterium]